MSDSNNRRLDREERLRAELFPEHQNSVFDTRKAGFVPVAIEYRKLLRYLTPPQVRILLYLLLRVSRAGICFPTIDEIAYDLGVAAKKHLRPLIADLERKGFIQVASSGGRTYYLILDPSVAITTLRKDGVIDDEHFLEINRLRGDLKREEISI
ncbi:MAG TPA: hypothetical protein VEO54_30720 [Thermoanaerobaculia bacterium]|nr:hypothetical protein [Thermoanaerobaculia bacterium]